MCMPGIYMGNEIELNCPMKDLASDEVKNNSTAFNAPVEQDTSDLWKSEINKGSLTALNFVANLLRQTLSRPQSLE